MLEPPIDLGHIPRRNMAAKSLLLIGRVEGSSISHDLGVVRGR
jgi:hypothetical protein